MQGGTRWGWRLARGQSCCDREGCGASGEAGEAGGKEQADSHDRAVMHRLVHGGSRVGMGWLNTPEST